MKTYNEKLYYKFLKMIGYWAAEASDVVILYIILFYTPYQVQLCQP